MKVVIVLLLAFGNINGLVLNKEGSEGGHPVNGKTKEQSWGKYAKNREHQVDATADPCDLKEI